ncbi:MAG: type II secretion system GspH family protein [Puniceicoccales bacterium]|jgi:prepilin-type N-terminal cleavage/methylation domain-containing protein|nr:type II secretion system GspH family protein [Puniceicoccales bacterium]
MMKAGDRKAFSLIEVLCAIVLFTTVMLPIIKYFMEHAAMPKVDQTAVALIADIDNCMTHRQDLRFSGEKQVHCLFAPNEHFKATCERLTVKSNLKLWTLTIKGYPRISRKIVAYLYEYVP